VATTPATMAMATTVATPAITMATPAISTVVIGTPATTVVIGSLTAPTQKRMAALGDMPHYGHSAQIDWTI